MPAARTTSARSDGSGRASSSRRRADALRLALVAAAAVAIATGVGAAAVAYAAPSASLAAACHETAPPGRLYTANVCITSPEDGATVAGDAPVTATVTVTGTGPGIRRLTFFLGSEYLLTDYEAPYTFTLPSAKFVDGPKTLEVEAWMRDGVITERTVANLTFQNGVTTPPVNTNTFTPKTGTDPGSGALVIGTAGDGAGGDQSASDVTDLISSWNPNLFFYLGDVYEKGTATEFSNWYRPPSYFGRFRSITNPTIGNHEYTNGSAAGYFDHWDNVPHYYSVNSHGWHLISLDTNGAFNEVAPGSPQYEWLASDLNANTESCTLVYYHQPLYNIGEQGPSTDLTAIWSLLAQHGVDLVVNGHDHTYQRWQPLDANGAPSPTGVTQIVVGTGGHALGTFVSTDSRVAASAAEFGALRLDLNRSGAGYQFVTTQGQTMDSGSVTCSDSTVDTTSPAPPTNLTATATYKTKIDLAWTAATDNVGVTGYRIFRDGQLLTTIGPEVTYADTTVVPGTTYTYRLRALDARGNVSGLSLPATATTPTAGVLFRDGFESGDLAAWTQSNGLTIQGLQVFAGSYAAEGSTSGAGGASAFKQLPQTETNLYYVTRFKVLSQAASTNINLLRLRNNLAGANPIATVFVTSLDRIGLRNDVTATATTSTAVAPRGAWHTVQVHVSLNGASSQTEVWLDGVPVPALSQSNVNLGTNSIGRVELGDPATTKTYDVVYDEVAYDRELIGDLLPPTAPTNVAASAHSGLEVELTWTPGTDDVGITGYDVYRNDVLIASIPAGSSYLDTTVSPLSFYTYKLRSKDAAGNVSGFSNLISASTGDLFRDDFETGDLSRWTTVAGAVAQQAFVDDGQWAARAASDGSAGASAQVTLPSAADDLFYRARFRIAGQGANSVSLLRFRTATNAALASAFVSSTGKLTFRNDTSAATETSGQSVSQSIWHELQVHLSVNGASSLAEVWLDGIKVITRTDSLGTASIGRLELGDPAAGRSFDVAFDNVLAGLAFIADEMPPSAPTNLLSPAHSATAVDLTWDHADDDVGVTGYRIYRDGIAIGNAEGSSNTYSDSGLTSSTAYTYRVTALDAVGHESAASNPVTVATSDVTKPSKPAGLSAVAAAGQNRVDLSWSAATDNVGVTGYRIYRNGSATALASVDPSTTTYGDTTVAAATTYSYTVTAVDAASNESDPSDPAGVTTFDTVAPLAPSGLLATAVSGTQINLSWIAATDNVGVTGYRIFRNGGATPIATVAGTATSFNNTGLTPGTAYTYTVRAVDAAGNLSVASNQVGATTFDTIAPTAPTSLTATAVSPTQINLSWVAATDNVGVTGYRILRNGGATPVATVSGTTTTYSNTGLAPGSYSYTVRAVDAAGNVSPASNTATAGTDTTSPSAPTGLVATAVNDTRINLTWSASTDNVGVTGYRIFRNGGATPITTVAATPTSYADTSVVGGNTYSYTVRAVDAAANVSALSNTASATTVVFFDNFETGNFSRWTSNSGLVAQTAHRFAGTWGARAQATGTTARFATKTLSRTFSTVYYTARLKVIASSTGNTDFMRLRTAGGGDLLSLRYDNLRRLRYRNVTRNVDVSSTTTLALNTWYEVKVRLTVNGASSQVQVWLNGTLISALSRTENFGTTPIGQVIAGESIAEQSYDFALDNVLVNTQP